LDIDDALAAYPLCCFDRYDLLGERIALGRVDHRTRERGIAAFESVVPA
jgi:hypothetical protein